MKILLLRFIQSDTDWSVFEFTALPEGQDVEIEDYLMFPECEDEDDDG